MSTNGFRIPAVALACALLDGLTAQAAFAAVGDRVPYQELKSATCTGAHECSVDFKPVGADRRLEVTSVSCLLRTTDGPPVSVKFLVLDAAGTTVMTDFGVPIQTGNDGLPGGFHFWTLNNQTFFFVKPGGKIRAVMTGPSDTVFDLGLDCKIAGEKVRVQ
jgi:hypothetical protein